MTFVCTKKKFCIKNGFSTNLWDDLKLLVYAKSCRPDTRIVYRACANDMVINFWGFCNCKFSLNFHGCKLCFKVVLDFLYMHFDRLITIVIHTLCKHKNNKMFDVNYGYHSKISWYYFSGCYSSGCYSSTNIRYSNKRNIPFITIVSSSPS